MKYYLKSFFLLIFTINFSYSQDCIEMGNRPASLIIGSIHDVKIICNWRKGTTEAKFNIIGLYTGQNTSNLVNLPIYLVKNGERIWQSTVNVKNGDTNDLIVEIPNNLTWTENDAKRFVIFSTMCTVGGQINGNSPNCPIIHQGGDIKCLMKDLKADFYLEQSKTNGETIIINTVPKTTTGVEHYWGIVGNGKAPNCNCACEDISLEDIKNAKTVGVWATHIKSDGTFENIGIGTNVASGTSGYGIKYGGFPYYGCYKITHYIICDNRVESFTTCVGQSRNN